MTVYKNSDDRWMVDVTITLPNGKEKRVRRVSPVQTKRGAQDYERDLRVAILNGDHDRNTKAAEAPTLEQWCELFIGEHSTPSNLTKSTIREQRGAWRNYFVPILGTSIRVDQVSRKHVLELRQRMTAQGLAPKTINNAVGVLTKAVGFYYESRELERPHLGMVRVKVPKGPPIFWEPSDYDRIARAAVELGPNYAVPILLMGDAGLRRGEVIALEWGHIRWGATATATSSIVVQRSFTDGEFGPTKGNKVRTLDLTSRLALALRQLPRGISAPWVLQRDGKHLTGKQLAWIVGVIERKAGFGKPRTAGQVHKLRHTFVTRLAAARVPARTIMEMAGHVSLLTTQRYMHAVAGGPAAATAALEAFDGATSERQDGGRGFGGESNPAS